MIKGSATVMLTGHGRKNFAQYILWASIALISLVIPANIAGQPLQSNQQPPPKKPPTIGKTGGGIGKTGGGAKDPGGTAKGGGIGKTGGGVTTKLEPKVESKPDTKPIITITKVVSKGFLAIVTTPSAQVSIRPFNGPVKTYTASKEDGQVSPGPLNQGKYELKFELPGYEPYTYTISIVNGTLAQLTRPLISKFGAVRLAMGKQAAKDVIVKLDGIEVPPDKLTIEHEMIYIPRVPVGPHNLTVDKPDHIGKSWDKFEVKPGEGIENALPVNLELATITLKVKSEPGARVYVDNKDKGVTNSNGVLDIPDLFPGLRKLRVELFGYETKEQTLTLSLDKREVTEEVKLISVIETAEGTDSFQTDIKNWVWNGSLNWDLTPGRGRLVKEDTVALFKQDSSQNHFSYYKDFTLIFRIGFKEGKSASWVVRAQDDQNYYLFELTPEKLIFYVYQNGKPTKQGESIVLVNLKKPGDYFRIRLMAVGNKLEHFIEVDSNATTGPVTLGQTFSNDLFDRGGVGFRGLKGSQFYLIDQFIVTPAAGPPM